MKVYIGQWLDTFSDHPEWHVDIDAAFLNEADAQAWVEKEESSRIQDLVDSRNKDEQARYQRNLVNYREDKALRQAGVRTTGNPLAEPTEPPVYTEPQWKSRPHHHYITVEAK